MRVLVVTWGWRSHLNHLVPHAWALRAAGHDVRVACPADLTEAVTGVGLSAVPVGERLDFATVATGQIARIRDEPGDSGGPERGPAGDSLPRSVTVGGVAHTYAATMLPDLVAFGRWFRPDLVLHEQNNLGAAVAAAALGAPSVRVLWGPDFALPMDRDAVLGPLAEPYGVAPSEVPLTGTLTLDPCPPPMQVPLTGPHRPVRFVPYNGVAVLPRWLRGPAGRPRVALSQGTLMPRLGFGAFDVRATVAALADVDAEFVLTVEPEPGQVLPSNVRPAPGLAHHLLLPTCAAVVHQGGAGTTMTAVACGVPQLVLPRVGDQHFNAERVVVAGAGAALQAERARPDAIRDAVIGLIGDARWQAAATQLRQRNDARPAPAEVVGHLTRLAGTAPVRRLERAHD
ncbi:nucleotide disphospho-sugar-binding domain-containing protein [Dactylosporangium sp. NPDC048998]|uniref:nucleotide disphospho-sugar-binding domain-containing protein n=1 Tax=Dactylosporangium sp. NPDC048998 TaxID=3363976 RepID=UPI003714B498